MRQILIYCALCVAVSAAASTAPSDSGVSVRLDLHGSDNFVYRVSINTNVKRYFPHSDLPNQYSRELTYSLIIRVGAIGKDGIVTMEANIDSMRLRAVLGGDEMRFNSQDFMAAQTVNLSDPELIGTTMILNKPFTYRMTLEGDFIDLQGFESWIGQIDSAVTLDSMARIGMKEYMTSSFLRKLVTPVEGFVYGRKYTPKQEWTTAVPRDVFGFAMIDTALYRIEIPSTHKRFFLFSDGRLFSHTAEIRDHGFKEVARVDSARGTMQDTVFLNGRGHIEELGRTAYIRAFLHTPQLAYSEDILETTTIRLEGYERR